MNKHAYKPMENFWGQIFIIKSGRRQDKYGEFHDLAAAQKKCDKLNGVKKK